MTESFQMDARAGWRGIWNKVTGQHKKRLRECAVALEALAEQNSAERQQMIAAQLKERRTLGHEMRQLRLHRSIETQSLRRAFGENLQNIELDSDRPLPAIDPRQPLVIEDEGDVDDSRNIRRRPEHIIEVLSRTRETFTRNGIVRGLRDHIDDPLKLRLAIDQVLQSKELIEVEQEPQPRFTARSFRAAEETLIAAVDSMAATHKHAVATRTITSAIREQNDILEKRVGAKLSDEQEQAIRHVLGPEQISAVVGFAGAGKSTALSAARTAWERQGYRVLGAALSGKAAAGLESSSGIASRTLASLEYSWELGFQTLGPGDILVIDEAGMVGTRQLSRITGHVRRSGAKLVLVGDPEQLQPIEAGKPFKDITERIRPAELTEIRRQKHDWQRDASIQLARQQTAQALQAYQDRGYVTITENTSSAISALVADYLARVCGA